MAAGRRVVGGSVTFLQMLGSTRDAKQCNRLALIFREDYLRFVLPSLSSSKSLRHLFTASPDLPYLSTLFCVWVAPDLALQLRL